jgi:negative regulator of genetic competence, sporulation and motility
VEVGQKDVLAWVEELGVKVAVLERTEAKEDEKKEEVKKKEDKKEGKEEGKKKEEDEH